MMKKFIRQKKRSDMGIGTMLLIAVFFLSIIYATIYSVIYMVGSGSVEINCTDLYYWVDKNTNQGNFYKSCKEGSVEATSTMNFTTMSQAVSSIKNGGNIYMLSTYVPGEDESVSIVGKSVTIQRYVYKGTNAVTGEEEVKAVLRDGPLFDVSTDFKIELTGKASCLAISGNQIESAAGAFKVSNGATLTLNNASTSSADGKNKDGIFTIEDNYCSLSIDYDYDEPDTPVLSGGGAINAVGGSVVANNVQFKGNRSINTGLSYGGAIYATNNGGVKSSLSLTKCLFENNTVRNSKLQLIASNTYGSLGVVPAYGGAVCSKGSRVDMDSCTFTGNAADTEKRNTIRAAGGAVYIDSTSEGSMKDCTVVNNQTSYCVRSGAGVCVEAGNNAFAISGKTVIKENYCYMLDDNRETGINVNDNLCLYNNEDNISISTSGVLEDSEIFVNVNPEPAKNKDLKALISNDGTESALENYFHSDVGGYKVQIENSSEYKGLYLVSSSEYDELWYKRVNSAQNVKGYYYKSFFYKDEDGKPKDTGLTYFVEAVASLNSSGTIHMQTTYEPSISETIDLPADKSVKVIREMDEYDSGTVDGSMFDMSDGTFTINATNPSSSIIFDGNKDVVSSDTYGGLFRVRGTSKLILNGADNGSGKTITVKDGKVSSNNRGGGIYISSGPSSISNCAITGCESEGGNGGGIYCYVTGGNTITLKDCTITGNKAALGGGIYCDNSANNLLLLGNVDITGNTNTNNDNDNLYFSIDEYGSPTAVLTGSDGALSDGSEIGVTTSKIPEEGTPVKFATSATEGMKEYFTSDNKDYIVKYNSSEKALYLAVPIYNDLWYKADDSGTKRFFEGTTKDNLTATDITKFSDAVGCVSDGGTIHMLTTYEAKAAGGETATVPEGRNITVIRDSSFKNASMFSVTSGEFAVNATDANSSITFDGNKSNISSATIDKGGVFYVNGNDAKLKLKGMEKSGEEKTIAIKNSYAKSAGGGICINKGASEISHCGIIGNTAKGGSGAGGAGICALGGSGTFTNCIISNNTVTYDGGGVFLDGVNTSLSFESCIFKGNTGGWGGAFRNVEGTLNIAKCKISENVSKGYGSYGLGEGAGLCLGTGGKKGINTLSDTEITSNKGNSNGAGLYFVGSSDSSLTLLGTMKIKGNTNSGSTNNFYIAKERVVKLSDESGNSLSVDSEIGLLTEVEPTSSSPVQFATNAGKDDMVYCFTSDSGYIIYKEGTNLYVAVAPSELYQSDNKFYLDAGKTKLTNIKTMAEAVKLATTVNMLSAYTVSSDETVEVPSSKNVTVSRYSTFANDSMIKVASGNFTVKATNTGSSITFDGQNVKTTVATACGGVIHVAGKDANGKVPSLTLSGADNSGKKTISFINSSVEGTSAGGAIRNNGTATITHCEISGNTSSPKDGSSISAGISNFGTITMENCIVSDNKSTGIYGGGIYTGSDAIKSTFTKCTITNNTSGQYGGGMYLSNGGDNGSPVSVISDCTVTGNTSGNDSTNGYGGGIYIGPGSGGKTTISGTKINENTAKGGALYVGGGTNEILSCTISDNVNGTWGGGVRVDGGTNTFEGCAATGNKASSRGGGFYFTTAGATTLTRCTISDNTAPAQGGAGIYFTKNGTNEDGTAGTLALSGSTSINGNKTIDSTDENNLWVGKGLTVEVSGLTEGSAVGVSTVESPEVGAPITFGTGADETIKGYFKSDDSEYRVALNGSELQLEVGDYDDLWYQTDTADNTKKFFSGDKIESLTPTKVTKFNVAVSKMNDGGRIHMLTSYDSSGSETTDIPAGKNLTVVRESSFATDSMFKITGGNFTINATDASSSIIFDGKDVGITKAINGGAFNISGDTTQFALNGADGSKNIQVINHVLTEVNTSSDGFEGDTSSSNYLDLFEYIGGEGGGIFIKGKGKSSFKNCLVSKNKSLIVGGISSFGNLEMSNCEITYNSSNLDNKFEGIVSIAGGIYGIGETSTLTNCTISSNTDYSGGAGGIAVCGTTNKILNCDITNNTGGSDSVSSNGGGIYITTGINNIIDCEVKNCEITGNKASYQGAGVYVNLVDGDNKVKISDSNISSNVCSGSEGHGGGVYINQSNVELKDCSITKNEASKYGSGIYAVGSAGKIYMLGTMNVTGNTMNGASNNLYLSNQVGGTVKPLLSDDSGNKLSSDSKIGVSTQESPPVKFAEKGDETMEDCFESDNASYIAMRIDSDFYLQPMYDNLYYSTKSGSGKFYSDSSCNNNTFMTKLSQAVRCSSSNGKIYMMNQYASSADETVNVPSGRNITVYRDTSFTDASMFHITGGTFTVNATDTSSSITFDGSSVTTTVEYGVGFYVHSNGNIQLNGAEKSGGGKTITIQYNKSLSPSAVEGGGIYLGGSTGKNTLKNCSIRKNKISSEIGRRAAILGGGIYLGGSTAVTNTLENCTITDNTGSNSDGGGVYISSGTNILLNCSITGNTVSSTSYGGGIYIIGGTNTLKDCSITNNTSSSSGGGVYIYKGTTTLLGTMNVTGNIAKGSTSNMHFSSSTIALSSGSESLSTSSKIGVTTSTAPTLSTNVQFATGATDAMKSCFTPDEANREVIYGSGYLYMKLAYDNLYYKGGTFYYDSNCSNSSGMTKLSDAVNHIKDGKYTSLSSMSVGKITFKSQYSHSDETVTVPSGHKIAMVRDVSVYSDTSMIDIHDGCTFKILVPDSSSNLIIDGGSKTASNSEGGLFNVNENSSNNLTLQGASSSYKNLTIQNFWSNGVGGAICFDRGSSTIKYCNFIGNKAMSSGTKGGAIFIGTDSNNKHDISYCYFKGNEALNSNGGAVRAENGTNTITNCTFEYNKAKYGGAVAFCGGTNSVTNCTMKSNATANTGSGGAVDDYDGTNTYTDCTIENNTCDGDEGGGFCVNNQGHNIIFAGKMIIRNNTAKNSTKCNAYIMDNKKFKIASNFSIESEIGITTKVSPSSSTAVEFATGVTESMDSVKYCFEHDPGTYRIFRSLTSLLVGNSGDSTYSNLYYYRTTTSNGQFYSNSSHTSSTGITTLQDAIGRLNKSGKIHMLSSYNTSTSGEAIVVPPNLGEIKVIRESSFKNESMINVNGSFEIQAPHTSSTLTFDGNSVETSDVGGGVLWLYQNCSIKIKGASSSNKNIKFINNVISSQGAGAIRVGAGSNNVLSNCIIENNKNTRSGSSQSGGILVTASDAAKDTAIEITSCDIKNNSSAYGGGLYVVSGSAKLYSCTISGNTSSYGGVYFSSGTNTLSGCTISGNTASSDGGGVYVSSGTATLSSCTISSNKSSSYGGGFYARGGTNTLSSCSIKGNTASYGGGVYVKGGTNTLSSCNITGNTASSNGGGVYVYENITLLGSTNILGNTSGGSSNNMYLSGSYTVALSNSSNSKLSTGSGIGVTTSRKPSSGSDVKFATNATDEWMKACFFSDSTSYDVVKKDSDLYLTTDTKTYSDLYYKDGFFYSDEALTNAVTSKLSSTMSELTSNGTIHMLSRYYSSVDEETNVPAGKNLTVVRDKSFTNASMFYISSGSFTINATNSNSSIIFDGNKANAAPTSSYDGGVFHNSSSGSKLTLNGNDKSGGGKTITIQNGKVKSSGYWGGAICTHGQTTINNCAILNNECEGNGGAIYNSSGTSVIKNSTITGNKSSSSGGGIYMSSGTVTLLGTVTITSNSASTGSDVYLYGSCTLTLSSGSESLNNNSKIGVRTSTSPTASTDVKFATGATSNMAGYFTSNADSTNYKSVYESGNLYLRRVYTTIYQNGHNFYTDQACSSKLDGVTNLARAVKIAENIIFKGDYTATSSETVTVPQGKKVTILRSDTFTNYSMFGLGGVTLTFNVPYADSKLIFDGGNINTTGAVGSLIHISNNSSNKFILKGYSASNKNIEVKNFHASLSQESGGAGGAICNIGSGWMDLENCKFTGNYANNAQGGAIYSISSSSESIINNCEFSDNHALNGKAGGTIFLNTGKHVVSNCNFHDNASSSASGGGVFIYGGTNRIESCTFTNNSGKWGGAVAIEAGTNVMKDCTLTGNTATTYGGGMYVSGGTNSFVGLINIKNNSAPTGKNLYLSQMISLKNGSTSLSTSSKIYVSTATYPTNSGSGGIQFAYNASSSHQGCFEPDLTSYTSGSVTCSLGIAYSGSALYFSVTGATA